MEPTGGDIRSDKVPHIEFGWAHARDSGGPLVVRELNRREDGVRGERPIRRFARSNFVASESIEEATFVPRAAADAPVLILGAYVTSKRGPL